MGQWGQLGLQLGSKEYDYPLVDGSRRINSGTEIGLGWQLAGDIFPHFGLSTTFGIGESDYKSWNSNVLTNKRHNYFQMAFFFEYTSHAKLGMTLGSGLTLRSNFTGGEYRYGGVQAIPDNILAPTLRVGIFWM